MKIQEALLTFTKHRRQMEIIKDKSGGCVFYTYHVLFLLFIIALLFGTIKVSTEDNNSKTIYSLELHFIKLFPVTKQI